MLTYALRRHCGNDVRWRACTFNYDFAAVTQVRGLRLLVYEALSY
jgi:hypothetical protein